MHPRAAKKADKDRQRAASHRAATGRDRAASWKRLEHAAHGQENPDKWDQDDMGDFQNLPSLESWNPNVIEEGYLRSERRRQDKATKKENEAKMSEMSGERTPPWVHDRYEKSETESVAASGEDDLVNWEKTRDVTNKAQKRPTESGGETSKSKDRRAPSAQASKGTKRPPEDDRPDDIDQCLMNLFADDRDKYLQSIEGESEPACEEKIPLPPELEDEAATWFYYDDISGKNLDAIESFPVWEKILRHKMPKGTRTIGTRWVDVNKQDEENPLYRSRLVAQEVKKGSGFDELFAAMPRFISFENASYNRSHVSASSRWNSS